MKPIAKALTCLVCLAVLPLAAGAQSDPFGAIDTVYADIAQVDENTWTVTISYFNDEDVVGLAVPFKMDAGTNQIVADSAVYTGGRVTEAEWVYPGFRPDTSSQSVTLGMIANLGPTNHKLTPGNGRIVTVYISSLEDKPIEKLSIDTTTTHPGNTLMAILDLVQGEAPDTVRIEVAERNIKPAWVVRYTE
jgi:hypothetical protein